MNNHFDHVSPSEKLKAETLKKAKRINWRPIFSVAAILVVMVGISFFAVPHLLGTGKNGAAPENNLYASNYENSTNQEASDSTNKGNSGYVLSDEADSSSGNTNSIPSESASDIFNSVGAPAQKTSSPTVSATALPDGSEHYINQNAKTMYVDAEKVIVRTYASDAAPEKFTLKKGQQVNAVVNSQGEWAYVSYEENGTYKYGYVLEEYLSTLKP